MSGAAPTTTASPRLRLREEPEDFVVDEIAAYAPTGEGEHTFVRVEKRLRTTEEVARDLARAAGVRPRDVGYAGRKDRRAVTRQWFSVPGLDPDAARGLELREAHVLEAARHPHKLRTGHLRGNRFEIAVRGVDMETAGSAEARLETLRRCGFPNRYGHQRFGARGDNAERARALLLGGSAGADRRAARFLLSALQAEAFNHVLRDRPIAIDRVAPGDLAMVHASGGIFEVEDEERENERAAAFEISATGPIFGTRMREPSGPAGRRERAVLDALGIPAASALRAPPGVRLRGTRRSLRARVEALSFRAEGDALHLRFTLGAGCYASVFLEELLGESLEGGAVPVR